MNASQEKRILDILSFLEKGSYFTKQQRKCNVVYTFSAVFGFKGLMLFLLRIINIPIKHN